MLQIALGIVMAFGIGAFCRWFDIPSPAPPKLVGALLVVAMTVGFLAHRPPSRRMMRLRGTLMLFVIHALDRPGALECPPRPL